MLLQVEFGRRSGHDEDVESDKKIVFMVHHSIVSSVGSHLPGKVGRLGRCQVGRMSMPSLWPISIATMSFSLS